MYVRKEIDSENEYLLLIHTNILATEKDKSERDWSLIRIYREKVCEKRDTLLLLLFPLFFCISSIFFILIIIIFLYVFL